MSTTSPNFGLVLASTSDVVSVTSHISNNFSTLDSVIGIVHTGTGQLKTGVSLTSPTIINPIISGSLTGAGIISASTGSFSTITATGGVVTVNALSVGTYGYPAAIGSTSQVLTVVTGNAVWAANSPGTGADAALSNLASVAINTSLNTFTAGFVTVNRIISTSGALTGITSFQATTGTFAGNVTVTGTLTANVVNCTGGAITAGGITIGTYALPGTIGATNSVLAVSGGTVSFSALPPLHAIYATSLQSVSFNPATNTSKVIVYTSKSYDFSSIYNTTVGTMTFANRAIMAVTGSISGIIAGTVAGGDPVSSLGFCVFINGTLNSTIASTTGSSVTGVAYSIGGSSFTIPITSGDVVSIRGNFTCGTSVNPVPTTITSGNFSAFIITTLG